MESLNRSLVVHTEDRAYSFPMTLAQGELLVPPGSFARCHNSFLVNMRRISKLDRKGLVLENGEWVPIGRSYYKAAQEKLVRFLNQA